MQYHIMHRDTIIAAADDERITEIIVPALCPKCFVVGMPLSELFNESDEVVYLSPEEKELLECFRLLAKDKADSLMTFLKTLT